MIDETITKEGVRIVKNGFTDTVTIDITDHGYEERGTWIYLTQRQWLDIVDYVIERGQKPYK